MSDTRYPSAQEGVMLLREAMQTANTGNPERALEILQQAERTHQKLQGSNLVKAGIFLRMSRYQDAKHAAQAELKHDPSSKDAKYLLSHVDVLLRQHKSTSANLSTPFGEVDQEFKPGFLTGKTQSTQPKRSAKTVDLRPIVKVLESKEFSVVLREVGKLKANRLSCENLDYLRALAFFGMNRPYDGLEAIREELRLFPNNQNALELLKRIQQDRPELNTAKNDDEVFSEVYSLIRPYTMLSEARLFSIYTLGRKVFEEDIPGVIVECGVAGGGSSALLAYLSKLFGNSRKVYAFDSYEGMPQPTEEDIHDGVTAESTGWGSGTCAGPVESLMEIGGKLGVEDILVPVKGYYEDTLPEWKHRLPEIAFLHADADWYQSTKEIFSHLYDKIHPRGFIQIDDFGYWEGCRKAVIEFEVERGIKLDLNKIDDTGVWCRKA
ncbi:TylF/MycF family methyltransferase [bacterium]|nr:TylF/MycF family methyltransferase [bacterium]